MKSLRSTLLLLAALPAAAIFVATQPLQAQPPAAQPAAAQTPAASRPDPWKALAFLLGTWDAKTSANQAVSSSGAYTFHEELKGHILARHSASDSCKGPAGFDCDHSDLLYAFQEMPHGPVHAIYLDNEGHVIHYSVTTPDPTTAVFLSDSAQPGPVFRLTYQRQGDTMSGKFQMQMPGQTEWHSYLEWSGQKLSDK